MPDSKKPKPSASKASEEAKITILYQAVKKHPHCHNTYYSSRQKDPVAKHKYHSGRHG